MHRHGLLQIFFLHILPSFNKSGQFWWLLRVGIYFIIRYVNICLSYKPHFLFSWQALEGVCKHGWAAQPEQQPAEEKAAMAHPGHPNHPADTRRNTHTHPGETTVVIYKSWIKEVLVKVGVSASWFKLHNDYGEGNCEARLKARKSVADRLTYVAYL